MITAPPTDDHAIEVLLERISLFNIRAIETRYAMSPANGSAMRGSHVPSIARLVRELPGQANVTFVLTDRTHILLPKLQRARLKTTVLEMPPLIKRDCENTA